MTKIVRIITRYSGIHSHFYPDDVAQEAYDGVIAALKEWKEFKNDRLETFSFNHPTSSFTFRLSEIDGAVISGIEDATLEKELAEITKRREGYMKNE